MSLLITCWILLFSLFSSLLFHVKLCSLFPNSSTLVLLGFFLPLLCLCFCLKAPWLDFRWLLRLKTSLSELLGSYCSNSVATSSDFLLGTSVKTFIPLSGFACLQKCLALFLFVFKWLKKDLSSSVYKSCSFDAFNRFLGSKSSADFGGLTFLPIWGFPLQVKDSPLLRLEKLLFDTKYKSSAWKTLFYTRMHSILREKRNFIVMKLDKINSTQFFIISFFFFM